MKNHHPSLLVVRGDEMREVISKLHVLCVFFCLIGDATQQNGTGCRSQVTHGVDGTKFNWTAVADGQWLSQPICLDVSFNVIARTCVDGRWEPEIVDECYSFRCPTGYTNSSIGCRAPRNYTDRTCTESDSSEEDADYCDYPRSFFFNLKEDTRKHALKFDAMQIMIILTAPSPDVQIDCYVKSVFGLTRPLRPVKVKRFFEPLNMYALHAIPYQAQYWCQVFEAQNFHPSVTEKFTDRRSRAHVFVLKANARIDTKNKLCKTMNCINGDDDVIYVKSGYEDLKDTHELILRNFITDVVYLRSTEFCLPEVMDDLHWGLTPIGAEATTDELCLDGDGRLVTRKCEGELFSGKGASWSQNRARCSDIDVPQRTKFLLEILNKEIDANVLDELARVDEFSSADLHLLSKGLRSVSPSAGPANFVKIINNAMRTNLDELRRAQAINSTDEILDSIENFVNAVALNGPTCIVEDNFIVEITNPAIDNVTGLAVYRGESKNSFVGYRLVELYANQTIGDLQTDDLELAVMIPENLLRILGATHEDLRIVIEIFYNDSLFVDGKDRWGGSKVVGVKIPGVVDLPEPITIYLRKSSDNISGDCAYWDYGSYRTGRWAIDGGATLNNDSLTQCSFTHLTHFALLILSDRLIVEEDADGVLISINPLDAHDLYLTIITGLGCTLSFIGAIVVFSSAILLKSWHAKRKFTVQLTASVVLELVIFQLAAVEDFQNRSTLCRSIGATLHYAILSKFSWMLLVAYVQHSRFIKIFDSVDISLLKATVIGWIAPLLLTTLSVVIYSDAYEAGALNFCHVRGDALYVFLLLPIIVVASVNIAIICLIMAKVSSSKVKKYNKSSNLTRKQANFAILLFFMLGIPWIFGLTAEFIPSVAGTTIFVYLFCLTATMQGFVMFVFNVVLDAESKKLWKDYFKRAKEKQTTSVKYTSTIEATSMFYDFS